MTSTLTSLEAAVARLPDGRGRRGRRYPLPFLLLGLVAGPLAGCDSTHAVEQWCAEPPTVEVVYLLTPLPPERASPADLLELVRGHWHIEKGLHHVRDAACDQDRSRRRTGHAPQFLVALHTW